jgi:hypothetical protein
MPPFPSSHLSSACVTLTRFCARRMLCFTSEGRGKPPKFIPIRFARINKLTKDDRLLLAFETLVLIQALRCNILAGKIICRNSQTAGPAAPEPNRHKHGYRASVHQAAYPVSD